MHVGLGIRNRTTGSFEAFLEAAVEIELQSPVVGGIAPRTHHKVDRGVGHSDDFDGGLRIIQDQFLSTEDG